VASEFRRLNQSEARVSNLGPYSHWRELRTLLLRGHEYHNTCHHYGSSFNPSLGPPSRVFGSETSLVYKSEHLRRDICLCDMPPRRDHSDGPESEEEEQSTTFPTKLIGRILQENFTSPNTRISADALAVTTEYLRIYTREAIWRAIQEKTKNDTVAGSLGTGLLEVEDLERMTGPLTLDFS
jgi:hypothetical protein